MSEFLTLSAVMSAVLFGLAVLANFGAWRYGLIVAAVGAPVTAGLIAFSGADLIRSWATLVAVTIVAFLSIALALIRARRHKAERLGKPD